MFLAYSNLKCWLLYSLFMFEFVPAVMVVIEYSQLPNSQLSQKTFAEPSFQIRYVTFCRKNRINWWLVGDCNQIWACLHTTNEHKNNISLATNSVKKWSFAIKSTYIGAFIGIIWTILELNVVSRRSGVGADVCSALNNGRGQKSVHSQLRRIMGRQVAMRWWPNAQHIISAPSLQSNACH